MDGYLYPTKITNGATSMFAAGRQLCDRNIRKAFRVVADAIPIRIVSKKKLEGYRRMALRDQLTGLFNRHGLAERLPVLAADAAKEGTTLSIIQIDVDNFKEVNDRRGHKGGDQALQDIAERMQKIVAHAISGTVRSNDLTVRMGGDELIVVVKGGMDIGKLVATRICRAVEELSNELGKITVSMGVAELNPRLLLNEKINFLTGEKIPVLERPSVVNAFNLADMAAEHTKDHGKNGVSVAVDGKIELIDQGEKRPVVQRGLKAAFVARAG